MCKMRCYCTLAGKQESKVVGYAGRRPAVKGLNATSDVGDNDSDAFGLVDGRS